MASEAVPLELLDPARSKGVLEHEEDGDASTHCGSEVFCSHFSEADYAELGLVVDVLAACCEGEALSAPQTAPRCRLLGGACCKPKDGTGEGEDAHFFAPERGVLGVADGVGGARKHLGHSSKAFAEELMAGCRFAASRPSAPCSDAAAAAKELLLEGCAAPQVDGASTAVVVRLEGAKECVGENGEEAGDRLGVAVLGDSRVLVVRWLDDDGPGKLIFKSPAQQHAFNQPFCACRLPEHVTGLLGRPADSPGDCLTFDIEVRAGDLVIACSDGVTDNLHDEEVLSLCCLAKAALRASCASCEASDLTSSGEVLARTVATKAYERSLDIMVMTPFKLDAMREGKLWSGGKEDDITVVAAWLV